MSEHDMPGLEWRGRRYGRWILDRSVSLVFRPFTGSRFLRVWQTKMHNAVIRRQMGQADFFQNPISSHVQRHVEVSPIR